MQKTILSQVLGQVLRPALNTEYLTAPEVGGGGGFSPSSLFASGEQGAWYDPSDFSTMFQDAAGTTPVTAVEQPVGLILDKRLGLEYGPELVTNGTFNSDASGWTPFGTATQSWVDGKLRVTAGASEGGGSIQSFAVTDNTTYRVRIKMSPGTGSRARIGIWSGGGYLNGQASSATTTEKELTFFFRTNGHTSIEVQVLPSTYNVHGAAGDYADFDDISVRELPGNHASQPTTASRPVLSARKNLLTKTEQFDNAAWQKSGLTGVTDGQADPFGENTAAKIVANTNSTRHAVYMTTVIPLTVDSVATVYAKAAGVGGIEVGIGNATYQSIYVDLTTGAITDASAAYTATSTSVGDGWWKITISGSRAADTQNLWFGCSSDNDAFFTGNEVDGILICRPQWEYGLTSTTYQRVNTDYDYDTVGFPHYLKFDGVDDFLSTGSIDFTATDKMTVVAGVQSNLNTYSNILELGPNSASENGFSLQRGFAGGGDYVGIMYGTSLGYAYTSNFAAPDTSVITAQYDIAESSIAGELAFRRNGVVAALATTAGNAGTGNFTSKPLYIGSRAGTSVHFNGHIYQLVVRGALTADLTPIESFTADKTGVTLP